MAQTLQAASAATPQRPLELPAPAPNKQKVERTNWAALDNFEKLEKAVGDWLCKGGDWEIGQSMGDFCIKVGIPKASFTCIVLLSDIGCALCRLCRYFSKYACDDETKRLPLPRPAG